MKTCTAIIQKKIEGSKFSTKERKGEKFPPCTTLRDIQNWADDLCGKNDKLIVIEIHQG